MASEIILLSSASYYQLASMKAYNKAISQHDFGLIYDSQKYYNTRNSLLLGAGIVYGINILDVIVSKTKKKKNKITYFDSKINIYPFYVANSTGVSLTITLN